MSTKQKCMSVLCFWFLFGLPIAAAPQQAVQTSSQNTSVMLAAVSRSDSMFVGGISCCKWTERRTVAVEPLARLTFSGKWTSIPCDGDHPTACRKFEHEYLSKSRIYTVVSADGKGARVHAVPTTLGDCYGYNGTGTYSGADIKNSAIAASSVDFFVDSPPLKLLSSMDTKPILDAVASRIPGGLDSPLYFKFLSLQLEGRDLIVAQRTLADYANKSKDDLKDPFAIGTMNHDQFQILHWKQEIEDEDEQVLGVIRLKSGHDFLVTSVNDSEAQWFRVYGIHNGELVIVYSGGGSSC